MLGLINRIRRYRWAVSGRRKIRKLVKQTHAHSRPIKIILGSSDHNPLKGDWINTDIPQFDITNEKHWAFIFGDIKIDYLLAEHVMEHLTEEQNRKVIFLSQQYLNKNGNFRIAIPDKNNNDPLYQAGVKPGGSDEGSQDHKIFFSIEDYKKIIYHSTFEITGLEYYDEKHLFHQVNFDNEKGFISRSKKNNFFYPPIPKYSSLIFDLTLSNKS